MARRRSGTALAPRAAPRHAIARVRPAPVIVLFVLAAAFPSAVHAIDDRHWSDEFGLAGTDRDISTMVVHDGKLIVAGDFSVAGNEPAPNIAAWDGTSWQAMGEGMRGVRALAVWQGMLVAGGSPWSAEGESPLEHGFARWDGSAWHAVATGAGDHSIQALHVVGDRLVARGELHLPPDTTGADSVFSVAEWDGDAWRGVVPASVYVGECTGYGDRVVAIDLAYMPGSGGTGVRAWDGAEWQALGDSVYGVAFAAVEWRGDLYLGGSVRLGSDEEPRSIVRWDGSAWGYLEAQPDSLLTGTLAVIGDRLYAAGDRRIMRWDGTTWEVVADRDDFITSALINAMVGFEGDVVMAGRFVTDGAACCVAAWDGLAWRGLGPGGSGLGPGASVAAAAAYRGGIVVGGAFQSVGRLRVSNIAWWDGSSWSALGAGLSGAVRVIRVSGDTLYAGGSFSSSGDTPVRNVARWDGVAWSALGGGVDGAVRALAMFRDDLYAGGTFRVAGSLPANRVARWDGHDWHAMGEGVRDPSQRGSDVYALLVAGDSLIVGGRFMMAGGLHAENIAAWDGAAWHTFGPGAGLARDVSALLLHEGRVVAASGSGVVAWTGTTWKALDQAMATSLVEYRGDLVAAGSIQIGSGWDNRIGLARWDGVSWIPFEAAPAGNIDVVAAVGEDLFAGGYFTQAGGKGSFGIARWRDALDGDVTAPALSLDLDPVEGAGGIVTVRLAASEVLRHPRVDANGREVELHYGVDGALTWTGFFRFAGTLEFVTVQADVEDLSGNKARAFADAAGFSALEIRAGNAVSPDSRLHLRFGGALEEGYYVTLVALGPGGTVPEWAGDGTAVLAGYAIGPPEFMAECPLYLDFHFTGLVPEGVDPLSLVIAGPSGEPLPTFCDPVAGVVTAAACDAGRYLVVLTGGPASMPVEPGYLALPAAGPNPFRDQYHMTFESRSRQPLLVDVFDVRGRHRARIFDGIVAVGSHDLTWDGSLADGARAAPGTYFLVARGSAMRITRRVVVTR